jgi:hypothetical protein
MKTNDLLIALVPVAALLIAAVAFVWILNYWNLFGWRY